MSIPTEDKGSNHQQPRLIAFASGKGGVGKTVCTANVALHLAETKNVLAVDLDLGSGNLNTTLGVRAITHSINDFLTSRSASLDEFKVQTEVPRLKLVTGAYTSIGPTSLAQEQKKRLVDSLRADSADYVLLDLGAGAGEEVLDLFAAADLKILVTSPESMALHNAFVFAKSFAYRTILRSLELAGVNRRKRNAICTQLYESSTEEIHTTISRIQREDEAAASIMAEALASAQIGVVLNKVENGNEERFRENLQRLVSKYADLNLISLGSIPYDENIKLSVNEIVPFALQYRESPANIGFREVSRQIEWTASRIEPQAYFDPAKNPFGRLASIVEQTWNSLSSQFRSDSAAPADLSLRLEPSHRDAREGAAQFEHLPKESEERDSQVQPLAEMDSFEPPSEVSHYAIREKPVLQASDGQPGAMARLQIAAEQMMEQLSHSLAETDTCIRDLETHVRERDQKINQLESHLSDRDGAISQLRSELRARMQAAQEQKQSLEALIANRDSQVRSLRQEVAENSRTLQNLQAQLRLNEEAAAEEIQDLRNKLAERESTIQSLESDLMAKEAQTLVIESELHDSKRTEERVRTDLEAKLNAAGDQKLQLESMVTEREMQVAETLRQLSDKSQFMRKLQDEHQVRLRAANEQKERLVRALAEKESTTDQLAEDLRMRDQKIALLEGELSQTAGIIQNVQHLLQKRGDNASSPDPQYTLSRVDTETE